MSLKKIRPGFYENEEGVMHVSIPELLEEHGFPDNEVNRDMLTKALCEEFAKVSPETQQVIVE